MKYRSHGIQTEIRQSGDRVAVRRTQPDEFRVLEDNVRKRSSSARKSDFMKPVAAIPTIVREKLAQTHPDVARGDRRAMERFLNSSEGRAYRTSPTGSSRSRVYMGKSHYGR